MADLKIKLGLVAGAAALFASSAFAQPTVGTIAPAAGYIRAEGTTERLPQTVIPINNAADGTVSVTVNLPAGTTVTSKTYGDDDTSETIATADGGGTSVAGTVNGNQVVFSGLTITGTTTQIVVNNIRIDATAFPVATGIGTPVNEQVVLTSGGSNVSVSPQFVIAYVTPGIGGIKTTGTSAANTVCSDIGVGTTQFKVNFAETFTKSFKTQAEESGTNLAEGSGADSGTRIQITFANVPANVKVYVPLVVSTDSSNGLGQLTLIKSATAANPGDGSNNAAAAGDGALAPLGAVAISGGTGTAYYELTTGTAPGINENFPVAVSFASTGGAVVPQTAAVTATVSFAATTKIPNFSTSIDSKSVDGSTYGPCSTYLLFPYVTNAAGFETGIAISNTSVDNFGDKGKSLAATQAGTCALNFYGNADATANPAAATTASIAGGTVSPFTLTSVAGADFTGYMIANCNFQYAHGFAYIVYNFGTSSGAAMGYVASPLTRTSTESVGLTDGVESLGN
jgi:hypothetical protein